MMVSESHWDLFGNTTASKVGFNDTFGDTIDINQSINQTPELSIDYEFNEAPVDNFIFIVDGVILTLVSLFGIVGTFMSIIVLVKPRIRGNSRDLFSKFLTALAVYDSLFLLVAILLFGLPALSVW